MKNYSRVLVCAINQQKWSHWQICSNSTTGSKIVTIITNWEPQTVNLCRILGISQSKIIFCSGKLSFVVDFQYFTIALAQFSQHFYVLNLWCIESNWLTKFLPFNTKSFLYIQSAKHWIHTLRLQKTNTSY